jgi:hypothetical protein
MKASKTKYEVWMKSCDRTVKNIFKYLEGSISDNERTNFENHVKLCPSCHKRLENSKLVKSSLAHLPKYKTSANFDTVFRARLRAETFNRRLPSWTAWRWQIPAYSTAAILLISTGILLQKTLQSPANMVSQPATQNIALETMPANALKVLERALPAGKYPKLKNYVLENVSMADVIKKSRKRSGHKSGILAAADSLSPQPRRDTPPIINQANVSSSYRF